MCPVYVVPYNLPPWACMQESNFMMALLIPKPKLLRKDFDLFFFEPLIEDLLDLWKTFSLCVAGLWCIPNYPALSTFLGRTTKGYFACIHCDKDPLSYGLSSKIGYFGHYLFLPNGHPLR